MHFAKEQGFIPVAGRDVCTANMFSMHLAAHLSRALTRLKAPFFDEAADLPLMQWWEMSLPSPNIGSFSACWHNV